MTLCHSMCTSRKLLRSKLWIERPLPPGSDEGVPPMRIVPPGILTLIKLVVLYDGQRCVLRFVTLLLPLTLIVSRSTMYANTTIRIIGHGSYHVYGCIRCIVVCYENFIHVTPLLKYLSDVIVDPLFSTQ